ncbi:aprataxin and PNK-like factor isoform X1 [Diorhabda sublineata]|uniref:aprataxin and PNK-like factor isoform X1 n=1 Tax=Diorhabda sublineata TaxID=1163346 RepID=UPI0024E0467E|nr:aprataxin and PNK-like factor isoform X1 [Diorhabda sublineata]
MTILNIYKEGDNNFSNELLCLEDGFHYIGRNSPIITHENPTYFKSSEDGPIEVLTHKNTMDLNNGNQFSLLENYIWFTVKISAEQTASTIVNDRKRVHKDNILVNEKRIKTENECASYHNVNSYLNTIPTVNYTDSEATKKYVELETPLKIKQEPIDIVPYVDSKTKVDDNKDHVLSTSNTLNIGRECCWYGRQCYRKNPDHRAKFSHPWDDDYVSNSNNNRPDCPFGIYCYRRYAMHRRQFKHFGPPAPRPTFAKINYHYPHNLK